MGPLVIPAKPNFRSRSEENVYHALIEALSSDDVIICNFEFTDLNLGDVEIDFIILLKDMGVVIVEVKGGHISFDGQDWVQSDSKSSRAIHPAAQAKRNMNTFREFLRNRWSQGNVKSDWIICFPDSQVKVSNSPDLPIEKIVDKNNLKFILSTIKNNLNAKSNAAAPSGKAWIEAALAHIKPKSLQEIDKESALGNNYAHIKELTHQSIELLGQLSDNEKFIVYGPAGSGKTWLAFEQAKIWIEQGLKIGIVAYNRGLVSYLHKKGLELQEGARPEFIGTFHEFAKQIGATAGAPANYNEENDPYASALMQAAERLTEEEKFDAFIVDEAQDFMSSWWTTLEISLRQNGKIGAFGDVNQKVFGKRNFPIYKYAKFKLKENIRNSKQIAELAALFSEESLVARGPNSFPVEMIEVPEQKVIAAADDMVERLTEKDNWHPGEIALLTTKNRHPVHAEIANKDRDLYWSDFWTNENVFYGTVGGFKGLERPVVILALDGFHNAEEFNDFMYVGLTRARDKLIVVGSRENLNRLMPSKTMIKD
jgi:ATP:corrinoid adenosyltransferase